MIYKFLIIAVNLAMVNTVHCKFTTTLFLGQRADDLDSVAYMESITDACVNSCANDIDQTEKINGVKSANYHLNKFLSASDKSTAYWPHS